MGGRMLWIGLGLVGCRGEPPVPQCADIRHSPIDVDLTGPVPVFSWDGDRPHGFAVLGADGTPRWELLCTCPADGCVEEADWERLACVPSPLTYGEVPDVPAIDRSDAVQLEALPLTPGVTYTVLIWSDCDAHGPNKVVQAADFLVPVR